MLLYYIRKDSRSTPPNRRVRWRFPSSECFALLFPITKSFAPYVLLIAVIVVIRNRLGRRRLTLKELCRRHKRISGKWIHGTSISTWWWGWWRTHCEKNGVGSYDTHRFHVDVERSRKTTKLVYKRASDDREGKRECQQHHDIRSENCY